MDKITEIRIEEIFDEENNQHYYWIYYFKNGEVKIFGKGMFDGSKKKIMGLK